MFSTTICRCAATGLLIAGIVCSAAFSGDAIAGGVDPESNTDSFNPAAELYEIGEARRLDLVGRQLGLHNLMVWSSYYEPGDLWGPPLGGPPIRQPIGYESKQVGPHRWIYRPVYAEDAPAGGATGAAAPTSEPLPVPRHAPALRNGRADLPAPSDAAPQDFVPPQAGPKKHKKPAPRGPREF